MKIMNLLFVIVLSLSTYASIKKENSKYLSIREKLEHTMALSMKINPSIKKAEMFKKFYMLNRTPYERKYCMLYAPKYIKAKKAPEWLHYEIKKALMDIHSPLALNAIKTIGELKLKRYSKNLVFLFSSLCEEPVRVEILKSLQSIHECKNVPVNQLLKHYSTKLVGCDSFALLLQMTAQFGNDASVKEVERFEKSILGIQEAIVRDPLMDIVKTIKGQNLLEKGGQNE